MAGFLAGLGRAGSGAMAGLRGSSAGLVRNRASRSFQAGNAIGRFAAWDARRELAQVGSSWTQVASKSVLYQVNKLWLNSVPEPAEILAAMHRGDLTREEVTLALSWHGIPTGNVAFNPNDANMAAWRSIQDNSRPDLSTSNYIEAWRMNDVHPTGVNRIEILEKLRREGITGRRAELLIGGDKDGIPPPTLPYTLDELYYLRDRGIIDFETWSKWMFALGYGNDTQIRTLWEVSDPLGIQVAFDALQWGNLRNRDEVEYYWKANGLREPEISLLWDTLKSAPTPPDVYRLWNWGKIGEAQAKKYLQINGFRESENDLMAELRKEIPGPSDLVRFAVREVWDPLIISTWGYDKEFPATFAHWMKAQGLDWAEDINTPDGVIPGVNWSMAHWSSHWDIYSPTQSAEILHRVRADNINHWRNVTGNVNLQPYSIDLHKDVLKIKDYPPGDGTTTFPRDWLTCISYRALDKRDLNWAAKFLEWTPEEIQEGYQDQGYAAADAVHLYDIGKARREYEADAPHRARKKALSNKWAGLALKQFRSGLATRGQVAVQLQLLEWDQLEIDAALDIAAVEAQTECWQSFITNMKRRFVGGEFSRDQLITELVAKGCQADRARYYADCWGALLTPKRKSMSVTQILSNLGECLITPAMAAVMLENLGYGNTETIILVAQAKHKCDLLSAKLAKAADADRAKAAAELQKIIREQQAHVKQLQAQVRQLTPWGRLKAWFVAGRISEDYLRDRLTAQGFDDDAVQLYVWEAEEAQRLDVAKRAASKGKNNGTATVNGAAKTSSSL